MVRRRDLDEMVADRAVKAGATLWPASEALAPLVEGGLVTGATILRRESGITETVRAKVVVVADGANSRFGRALGTQRDRSYPMGMAIRGYFTSPYHDEPWIESHLDLRDRDGNYMPGYGWIFPVGDGTINVGVGLLDTFTGFKTVNTTKLMDAFIATAPARWGISPETSCGPPTGGKLPTGRLRDPEGGPHLDRRGRRGRLDQPLQRRGDRLRLRDRPDGRRRGPRGPRPPATASPWPGTRTSSTPATASTSRSPARS